MDGTNLPLSSLKKPLELGVMLPHKVKRGKKEEIIKPPGVRIVKKEPVFLKELETIMKSCFLPSEEGKVQKQIMTRLPYAYLDAVNVADAYTFYGKTRTQINKKLDYYAKEQGNATKRLIQALSPQAKPLSKTATAKLNDTIQWATEHIELAETAREATSVSGGTPIDWFRRCLLIELFHLYAVVTRKNPTQQPDETWHVLVWVLKNYYRTHTVRDPLVHVEERTVSPRDVSYLQRQWRKGNRQHFPRHTLRDWPKR